MAPLHFFLMTSSNDIVFEETNDKIADDGLATDKQIASVIRLVKAIKLT